MVIVVLVSFSLMRVSMWQHVLLYLLRVIVFKKVKSMMCFYHERFSRSVSGYICLALHVEWYWTCGVEEVRMWPHSNTHLKQYVAL